MGTRRAVMLLLLLLGFARGLWAAEPHTIDEFVDLALKNNPEIAQATLEWKAAQSRISPARTLPDPKIGLSYMNMGGAPSLGSDMNTLLGVSFSQMVPGKGKLPLMGKVMEADADRMKTMIDMKKWEITAQVKRTYFSLYHADRMLGILGETRTLLKTMEQNMESMYAVGMAPQQDVLKAQLSLSKLTADELDLKRARSQYEIELNKLLGRSATTPIQNLEVMEMMHWPYTIEQLQQIALAASPALLLEKRGVKMQEYRIDLARAEFKPDAMFGYTQYTRGGIGSAWQVLAEYTWPLYKNKKQSYNLLEAQQSKEAAEAGFQSRKNQVFQEIDAMLASLNTNRQLYDLLTSTLVPQAQLTYQASLSAYQVGKADFLTFLDSLMNLYDFKMRIHMTLQAFHGEAAEIEAMVGAPLDKSMSMEMDSEMEQPKPAAGGGFSSKSQGGGNNGQ